ncbi:hypothetical protein DV736_g5022, partial [Chaetothyriales sp. CBS 134916]
MIGLKLDTPKESTGDVLSQPPPPSFKNRYLDPNHPATNDGLLGLVSGLQEQQLCQQAELVNTGTGQVRTIWFYFRMFHI